MTPDDAKAGEAVRRGKGAGQGDGVVCLKGWQVGDGCVRCHKCHGCRRSSGSRITLSPARLVAGIRLTSSVELCAAGFECPVQASC